MFLDLPLHFINCPNLNGGGQKIDPIFYDYPGNYHGH
jgi:hypothetical protein